MAISLEELKDAFERHNQMLLSADRDDQQRGRIVLLSVHLETLLGTILLALAKEKKTMKELLRRSGGSFQSRIDLCFALGLIDRIEKSNLDLFRKIRNKLAHELEVKPNDPQILGWARDLSIHQFTETDIEAQPAMAHFKDFVENANALGRIEICLGMLSSKLTIRIDQVQDLGEELSRAKLL